MTNLSAGWIAARFGLTATLRAGLALRIGPAAAMAAATWLCALHLMGARGAAASAEAADVVLLVDHLDRLPPGIEVAQRSRRIAVESVAAGIGLSVLGMIAAAFGYLI